MFEQKRFAARYLLTLESQKLNYFGKKGGAGVLTLQCNSRLWKRLSPLAIYSAITKYRGVLMCASC